MPAARRKCKRNKRSIFGNDMLIRCLQVDQDPRRYHRLFEQGEVESHQPLFKGIPLKRPAILRMSRVKDKEPRLECLKSDEKVMEMLTRNAQ